MDNVIVTVIAGLLFCCVVLGVIGVRGVDSAVEQRESARTVMKIAGERGEESKRLAYRQSSKDTWEAFAVRRNAFLFALADRWHSFSLSVMLLAGTVIGSIISLGTIILTYWVLLKTLTTLFYWLHEQQRRALLNIKPHHTTTVVRLSDTLAWRQLGLLHSSIKMVSPKTNDDNS